MNNLPTAGHTITFLWDMTPCSLVASYRLVGEIYGLYLSGLKSPSIFDIELGGSGIFQNVRMLLEAS